MKSIVGIISLVLFIQATRGKDSMMVMVESPAMNQLENFAKTHPNDSVEYARTFSGIVYPTLTASLKVGPNGPVLLQDRFLIEKLQTFNRERIPERVVHAKGTGAHGYFEVTNNNMSQYTKADFLQPGKRTKVAVRFSGADGELGSADTLLDMRGFAVKFYTEEGNHDITGINFPVFHTRDAMMFPDINKIRKRNPQTNLPDPMATLDFLSERPETCFFILYFFKDMGNPKSFRCIEGHAIHAFKMVNVHGEVVYVKFHWIPQQKQEFFTFEEAVQMTAENPNHFVQDLFDNIANKNYPKWTLNIQVMTLEQAEKHPVDPFDVTKIWQLDEFPYVPVGVLTLNENSQNFFAQIEQLAFSPSNLVPGIEPGPDPVLHARMFAYPDAQYYRLGVNYGHLLVNSCPFAKTYQRDGAMAVGTNGGPGPNYYPNTFNGLKSNDNKSYKQTAFSLSGDVDRVDVRGEDNFSQATRHWKGISSDEKQRMIKNVAGALKLANRRIQDKFLKNVIYNIGKDFGDGVKAAMKA